MQTVEPGIRNALKAYTTDADSLAESLMMEGHECYPWTIENIQEAIANSGNGELAVMAATCMVAICKQDRRNDHSNHLALTAIKQVVEGYWRDMARVLAQRLIDAGR